MKAQSIDTQIIQQAVAALERAQLVAFPTETVYGLGADATNPVALKRLYETKGRPDNHPVIVHLANINQLQEWAAYVPEKAYALAQKFWPGPMTIILNRAKGVLDQVTGGQETIGLRIPSHPMALQLLREFGKGIAAPSANKFGRLSPTCAQDVRAELKEAVAVVLDGGLCTVGIESTIIDCTTSTPSILRPGMILPEQIAAVVGGEVSSINITNQPAAIRTPGGLLSHYAPQTSMHLINTADLDTEIAKWHAKNKSVCVLSFLQHQQPGINKTIVASADPEEYARMLYQYLRILDAQESNAILVEKVSCSPEWAGIADRLMRAAAK